ncbi:MAG: hypothetical protein JOZ63_07810 [Planctomycetaceae bacterium]|nr:hypothetical protein [Planctomycetaceae bacterium]
MSTPIVRPDPARSKHEPFAAIPHAACVSDLSDAAYRVLGAVLYFARRGSCDATDRQLGQRCGKSVTAIKRSLKELEVKGWIERLRGGGPFRVIRLRAPGDPVPAEVILYPLGSAPGTRPEVGQSRRTSEQGTRPEVGQSPPRSGPVPAHFRPPTRPEVGQSPPRSGPVPAHFRPPLKKGEGEQSEERRESSPVPGRGPTTPAAEGDEDELAELQRLVTAGGPVARMARARLAELGAGVAAEGRPAEAAPRA